MKQIKHVLSGILAYFCLVVLMTLIAFVNLVDAIIDSVAKDTIRLLIKAQSKKFTHPIKR